MDVVPRCNFLSEVRFVMLLARLFPTNFQGFFVVSPIILNDADWLIFSVILLFFGVVLRTA